MFATNERIVLGDELDINSAQNFAPIAGDIFVRVRLLKARADRLLRRQIDFAAYCRAQAAAARRSCERSRFPELHRSMLRVALSYERMAKSSEELVSRFGETANDSEDWPSDAGSGIAGAWVEPSAAAPRPPRDPSSISTPIGRGGLPVGKSLDCA